MQKKSFERKNDKKNGIHNVAVISNKKHKLNGIKLSKIST